MTRIRMTWIAMLVLAACSPNAPLASADSAGTRGPTVSQTPLSSTVAAGRPVAGIVVRLGAERCGCAGQRVSTSGASPAVAGGTVTIAGRMTGSGRRVRGSTQRLRVGLHGGRSQGPWNVV